MPQMPTHKQLPHKALACTRYHRPIRERTKQKQEMVKYHRSKKSTTQRFSRTSKTNLRVAKPTKQPKERPHTKNPKLLLERTTRSRQTVKGGSRGIKHKPLLPI